MRYRLMYVETGALRLIGVVQEGSCRGVMVRQACKQVKLEQAGATIPT